jgi:hypothetical protein
MSTSPQDYARRDVPEQVASKAPGGGDPVVFNAADPNARRDVPEQVASKAPGGGDPVVFNAADPNARREPQNDNSFAVENAV